MCNSSCCDLSSLGINSVWAQDCALWLAVQTVCMALTLPLTVGLLMLLGWNLYLALVNRTTIEYHEGVTANIQVRPCHAHLPCLPVLLEWQRKPPTLLCNRSSPCSTASSSLLL